MIDYQLSIPKKSFSLDESIPINIKIIPLIKEFKLHSIETLLVQKITCMKNEYETEFIQYSNDDNNNFNEVENNKIENLIYEKMLEFDLSKCYSNINNNNNNIIYHSVETSLIKIKHELKLCCILSIPNRKKKNFNHRVKNKLCFNVRINLLSCLTKKDVIMSLPKYDDVSFYCNCHPEYQRIARFVLGDSFNSRNDGRCDGLTCNLADNKPPRYSKYS